MSAEDEKTPLELLKDELGETLGGLNTTTGEDGLPTVLKEALSLINSVGTDQMLEQLGSAVVGRDPEDDSPAELDDVVVPAQRKRGKDIPARTVQDLINDSQGPQMAMALLLDKYIRLVIDERFGPAEVPPS